MAADTRGIGAMGEGDPHRMNLRLGRRAKAIVYMRYKEEGFRSGSAYIRWLVERDYRRSRFRLVDVECSQNAAGERDEEVRRVGH